MRDDVYNLENEEHTRLKMMMFLTELDVNLKQMIKDVDLLLIEEANIKVVALENENIVEDGPATISSRPILKSASMYASEYKNMHNRSKQEHIHNSTVSTLLALMDGLDSRGQVVLIRATNRIDAIDGALRRPGRCDCEFTFRLPGLDVRVEILDIHKRKWKQPPVKELKLELVASCVGYYGVDLKALCTEAAIHAFCEKYPQFTPMTISF
uniref:ATPase AAA-type core domain-containing protein n=1 Tax=Lactuca sativa TaxID=4236 RepID=A0A9R1XEG2_LACSA|nr:hypothetical protein LSAT_V11C400226270 [Lactuca sativa]